MQLVRDFDKTLLFEKDYVNGMISQPEETIQMNIFLFKVAVETVENSVNYVQSYE